MANYLEKIFNAFGQGSTRLFIIDCVAKNGNLMEYEALIEKVMAERNIRRPAVRWHIRKLLEKKQLKMEGSKLSLLEPVKLIPSEPSPWEIWPIVGIPLGISLLIISSFEQSPLFLLTSLLFLLYALCVNIREIHRYLKKRTP